ncbi:MAG: FadR/GntR family transcriptional regulator [Rhizobiaceae bacterium]
MSDSIFDKLTINPAYRVVADAIEQNIVEGRLKVGDRLPAETEIAKQFGVHRSTVREGLRLLEESGLVSRVGRMTLEVRLPHFRELATRASRALSMHQVTFQELWDASMITEPAIAERAAEHISGDELDALKANIAAMEACGEQTEQFVKLDIEFHDIIAKASRNKVFRLMREPISLLFLPAGQTILPTIKTYERVIEAHRRIHQALAARDKAVAQEWMTRHMADFRRGYLRTGANPDRPLRPPHIGMPASR